LNHMPRMVRGRDERERRSAIPIILGLGAGGAILWWALRARAAPGPTPEEPIRPSRCRVLELTSPNMQGDDVRAVQQALLRAGYSLGPAGVDGLYGPDTEAAVRGFQLANGLPVTGVVDAATYAALGIECPAAPPPEEKPVGAILNVQYMPAG